MIRNAYTLGIFMNSCWIGFTFKDWNYLTFSNWVQMSMDICCTSSSGNSRLIGSCDYVIISTLYGQARDEKLNSKENLYLAVSEIVGFTDIEIKEDILSAFQSTYITSIPIDGSQQELLSAVTTLEKHVMAEGKYSTVNDYLEAQGIIVSQSWALLSNEAGFPIDDKYIEDTD